MSISCRIGVHDWSEWGALANGYSGLTQFRKCNCCKKASYSGIYGNQVRANIINELLGFDKKDDES